MQNYRSYQQENLSLHQNSFWILQGFAFLLGIAIPISTILQNITVLLVPLFVLLIPLLRQRLISYWYTPVGRVGLVFFALIVLGCIWSTAVWPDRLNTVIKMRWLILLPFLLAFFSLRNTAISGAFGFASGVIISALLSIICAMTNWEIMKASHGDWSIFRTHSYHNYFIALVVYGSIILLSEKIFPRWRNLILLTISLLLLDAFCLVQGRSGNLIMLSLLIVFAIQKFRWRGLVISLVFIPMIVFFLCSLPSIQRGIEKAHDDVLRYHQGYTETSIGLRLEFYKNSLQLISHRPWLGQGTGAFTQSYQALTGFTTGDRATTNPHNDYFKVMIELGLPGLLAFIGLILAPLWQARDYPDIQRWLVQGLVISMALASTVNSFFTDNITSSGFIVLLSILFVRFQQSTSESLAQNNKLK